MSLHARNVPAAMDGRFDAPSVNRERAPLLPALLMAAVMVHAFVGERLYVEAGTGGRGLISVSAAVVPALVALYCLFATSSIAGLWRRRAFWLGAGTLNVLMLLLPLLGLVLMGYPSRSLFAATEGAMALAAIAAGYVLRRRTTRAAHIAVALVAVGGFVQVLATLGQSGLVLDAVTQPFLDWDESVRAAFGADQVVAGRAIGTFINPNTLGLAIVLGILYASYAWRGIGRVLAWGGGGIALLLSQSRGAFLALVISTAAVWLVQPAQFRRVRLGRLAGVLIAVGVLLGLAATPLPAAAMRAADGIPVVEAWAERTSSGIQGLTTGYGDENLSTRYDVWAEALEFSAAYPFGTFGPPQMLFGQSIDNEFVRLWCQGGAIALAAFLLVLISAYRLAGQSVEARLAWHSLLALAIASGSAVTLGNPPAALAWVSVGLALGAGGDLPGARRHAQPRVIQAAGPLSANGRR